MSIRREDYCCESLELVENYASAKADDFKGWCMHHRLEIQPDGTRVSRQELKDKGLYFGRPASELIFMRFGEHSAMHNAGNSHAKGSKSKKGQHLSAETRQKLSEAAKGKHLSNEHRQKLSEAAKGKTFSEETRKKISEAIKGENHPLFGKTLSNEHRQKLSEAAKGKHLWNNGVSCKFSRECPGEGWTRGFLRFK